MASGRCGMSLISSENVYQKKYYTVLVILRRNADSAFLLKRSKGSCCVVVSITDQQSVDPSSIPGSTIDLLFVFYKHDFIPTKWSG